MFTKNTTTTTATMRIQRFNPEVDEKPYYDEFTIVLDRDKTLLDGLQEIKTQQDGSLTYRRSCRHAICGSCAMNVNGQNMLVCNTPLKKMLDRSGKVTIRPLPWLPIIKDLVVDRTYFWEQYMAVKPWLIPADLKAKKEYRMTQEEVDALLEAETCIMCGACYSACPVIATNKKYIGPHALQKAYQRVMDPRDGGLEERLDLLESDHFGIYNCHTATDCITACPKGLNPARTISTLRKIALKREQFIADRKERQKHLLEPTDG
ncbi:MAG: succinate dehydrogenase iron-sulfur subunit [Anaerolineales bacterium]|nr:succinate dehydrogenase iron-sulfur subunit [Anaerolineales bacterium]